LGGAVNVTTQIGFIRIAVTAPTKYTRGDQKGKLEGCELASGEYRRYCDAERGLSGAWTVAGV